MSGYLVGSAAFKAVGTSDPRPAGSIPVHLRQEHAGQLRLVVNPNCKQSQNGRRRLSGSGDGRRSQPDTLSRRPRWPCIRFAVSATEGVDGWTDGDLVEAAVLEHLLPARTGQPSGDSTGPQIDVAYRFERYGAAVDDVGEL